MTRSSPVRSGTLWRQRDFLKLWLAQTISAFGSQFTMLALPLTAILELGASATQVGMLYAAGQIPFLFASLPAGVWVDRSNRRPLLVATDIGRALLLGSVPLTALLGVLRMEQLYAVAFGTGMLSVLFEVAHSAYVPTLVPRDQLVAGNSKFQMSYSSAETIGPGTAGVVVQVLTAPIAILVDTVSFLVSAVLIQCIARPEGRMVPAPQDQSIRREMAEGLRALLGHRLLRPIVLASATIGIFANAIFAIIVLYATRELGISPVMVGLIFAVGGLGPVAGSILAGAMAQRFGVGPVIVGGYFLKALALVLPPLTTGALAPALLMASVMLWGIAAAASNVNQWSLRQAVTPDHLQGRVTASQRFLVWGSYPLGSLFGGFLASIIGLRPTILLCAIGAMLGSLWVAFSPVRRVREQPGITAGDGGPPTSSNY